MPHHVCVSHLCTAIIIAAIIAAIIAIIIATVITTIATHTISITQEPMQEVSAKEPVQAFVGTLAQSPQGIPSKSFVLPLLGGHGARKWGTIGSLGRLSPVLMSWP